MMPEPSHTEPTNFLESTSTTVAKSKFSFMAGVSLSLSCLSVLIGPLGYIPGIIFGHAARSECKRNPELMGSGMALAGLVIGYFCLILTILVVALIIHYLDFTLTTFKTTDPDAFYRFLEELRKFLSTIKT